MKESKQKILFIVQLPPPVHGASAMNAFAVKSAHIRSAFDVAVLPLQFADSVKDIGTLGVKKLWKMVLFCFRLFAMLWRYQPQLVYFTIAPVGGAFYRDALFSLIIKCFRVKIVYHLHGKGIQQDAASNAFKKAIYKFTFRNSYVIVLAQSLKTDISSIYNGQPFILHNGLPQEEDAAAEPPAAVPTLLFLSNLVEAKGIVLFLECIKQLKNKNIPFKALIAGAPFDVSLETVNTFIQANGLEQQAAVLGPVYGKGKQKVLHSAHMLLFPSYYGNEAFPITILEAMRAGLPVIASNNGAISEIVDDGVTGFVTPVKNVAALVQKTEQLLMDAPLRSAMGQKGKEKFEQLFTIEQFEQKLFKIFTEILN